MTAQNFVYWLQGFMELQDPKVINKEQLKDIQDHLRIAFKYNIDLSYGDKEHQLELSKIHNPEHFEDLDELDMFRPGIDTTAYNC